jgi:hypothetical protein
MRNRLARQLAGRQHSERRRAQDDEALGYSDRSSEGSNCLTCGRAFNRNRSRGHQPPLRLMRQYIQRGIEPPYKPVVIAQCLPCNLAQGYQLLHDWKPDLPPMDWLLAWKAGDQPPKRERDPNTPPFRDWFDSELDQREPDEDGWVCPTHGQNALTYLISTKGRRYRVCRTCVELETSYASYIDMMSEPVPVPPKAAAIFDLMAMGIRQGWTCQIHGQERKVISRESGSYLACPACPEWALPEVRREPRPLASTVERIATDGEPWYEDINDAMAEAFGPTGYVPYVPEDEPRGG